MIEQDIFEPSEKISDIRPDGPFGVSGQVSTFRFPDRLHPLGKVGIIGREYARLWETALCSASPSIRNPSGWRRDPSCGA
jgi:hypothetical protein